MKTPTPEELAELERLRNEVPPPPLTEEEVEQSKPEMQEGMRLQDTIPSEKNKPVFVLEDKDLGVKTGKNKNESEIIPGWKVENEKNPARKPPHIEGALKTGLKAGLTSMMGLFR